MRGGPVRVWVADVEGGRVRVLERTRASLRSQLAWAPGARIAYQAGNNRNLMLVDPRTGEERALLSDPTSATGWLFSPRYSPDGGRLAVTWNRTEPNPDFGVWVFDLESRDSAKLNGLGIWPVGWSPDGRYVYTQGPTTIFRIDVTGSRPQETAQELPWRQAECSPAGRLHPRAFICAVFESVSDVWMIEDFD
jgi:Tol biopolymer transport system component